MKKLISLLLILCMVCMLVPAMAEDSAAGTWYLTGAAQNGVDMPASALGMSMTMILNEDGTAAVTTAYGEEKLDQTGTWTQDGATVTVTVDEVPGVFTLADGKLTMDQPEYQMFFSQEAPAEDAGETAAASTVAAESEEAFFGTWELSSVEILGQAVPVALLSTFGLDLSVTLTIEAGKAVLVFAYNGESKEAPIETSFADGKLMLVAEGSELAPLSLTESGELAFILPIEGQNFSLLLTPAAAAAEPAA